MEKEKTIQEEAHEALHAIFANDRKQMFPFLKIALGKPAKTTKVTLQMDEADARAFLVLLHFFAAELRWSHSKLSEADGRLHRHFLWHSTKEELRLLYLLRNGCSVGAISRKLSASVDWVHEKLYRMLSRGAVLGQFSHVEDWIQKTVRDEDIWKELSATYDENLDLFAARFAFRRKMSLVQGIHLAAYYARDMLAKQILGCRQTKAAEIAV